MSDVKCPVCARRDPRDGLTVCDTCLGRLDDDLARIVELTRLAAGWLSPRTNGSDGGHTVPGSRPPLSVAALDAAIGHDALGLLESWEKLVREHFGLSQYGPASLSRNSRLSLARGTISPTGGPGSAGTLRGLDNASKER